MCIIEKNDYLQVIKKRKNEFYWNITSGTQIVYVLEGEINISRFGYDSNILKNNIVILKDNEINKIIFKNDYNILIVININSFSDRLTSDVNTKIFLDNLDNEIIFFDSEIIQLIFKLIGVYKDKDDFKFIKLKSIQYEIIHTIISRYSINLQDSNTYIKRTNSERLERIIAFIKSNYMNNITLKEAAESEYLTPQYFSKLFKSETGITFFTYLNNYRLNKSINYLLNTDLSILEIALMNGFNSVRTYNVVFYERYGQTPYKYRKLIKADENQKFNQYGEIDKVDLDEIHMIMEYNLLRYKDLLNNTKKINYCIANIDVFKNISVMDRVWKELITVGRAKLLQSEGIRRQIEMAQKEINFKYIRFHGIFNDDMHVYDEDDSGNIVLDFKYANEVINYILSIGLKPFIELGFMPKKLAKYKEQNILNNMFNISIPKSMKKWNYLIDSFIRNCINLYGIEEVNSWYFEFWNEPNLFEIHKTKITKELSKDMVKENRFWVGTFQQYLKLYHNTYKTIKNTNNDIKIGGPSVEASSLFIGNWFDEYIKFMEQNNCTIDFLTLHLYHNDEYSVENIEQGLQPTKINDFEEYIDKTLDKVHSLLISKSLKFDIHITEWNLLFRNSIENTHINNVNDTSYKACYIIENMINNLGKFSSIGYWTFSDYIETIKGKNNTIFNDSVGLITVNGIKKAAYNAYVLLNKLGSNILYKGENFIVTSKGKNIQVLLYFCDYNSAINKEEKYNIIDYKVNLFNMKNGKYEEKIYTINEYSGSVYDYWSRMGGQDVLTDEDMKYLKSKSMIEYKKRVIEVTDKYELEILIKNNEIKLIEYIYIY